MFSHPNPSLNATSRRDSRTRALPRHVRWCSGGLGATAHCSRSSEPRLRGAHPLEQPPAHSQNRENQEKKGEKSEPLIQNYLRNIIE